MRRLTVLILLVLVVLLSAEAGAADWTKWRGPSADGISGENGINKNWNQNPPKMLWKTAMGDEGYAGPSVADGNVFIIDHKDKQDWVRAIDINTGVDLWGSLFPDAEGSNHGYCQATPIIDSRRVYAQLRFGTLLCLDEKTGKKIWSRDILTDFHGKKPTWNYAWSPVIDGNKIIILPGGPNATMVALDKTTGKTIWQGGGSDLPGYGSVTVATVGGKKQYVALMGVSAIGVDADNGALLWDIPWKTKYDINGATPLQIGPNLVFITSGYAHGSGLLELSATAAKVIWESKDIMGKFSSPILLDDVLYGISEPGDLVCLDPKTGKAKWKKSGFDFGGLLAVDGVLLAQDGAKGDIYMVKPSPDAYVELGKWNPLGGQSWTAPIIAEGYYIVRNTKELACYRAKDN